MVSLNEEKIYRIRYDIGGREMTYFVGQELVKLNKTITRITRNEEAFHTFGVIRYDIFATEFDEDIEHLIRVVENAPVEVTFEKNS